MPGYEILFRDAIAATECDLSAQEVRETHPETAYAIDTRLFPFEASWEEHGINCRSLLV